MQTHPGVDTSATLRSGEPSAATALQAACCCCSTCAGGDPAWPKLACAHGKGVAQLKEDALHHSGQGCNDCKSSPLHIFALLATCMHLLEDENNKSCTW